MGSLSAIYQAGSSLADYLRRSRPAELGTVPCEFYSTGQIVATAPAEPMLVILLYGLSMDEYSRNAARSSGPSAGTVPLGVNMHLLLTAWASTAPQEHLIMGWAMRQLFMTPVLDRSSLLPAEEWGLEDRIQIVAVEPNFEQIIRLWEGLRLPYRLSAPYLARVVKIDVPPEPPQPPVVARRFAYTPYSGEAIDPLVDDFNERTRGQ